MKKKTALVLSGGGSRGAYQIGAWRALEELGWEFDMVVGVSVGSLNGSMVAQGERFLAETLWRQLETDHIFDVNKNATTADFALEFIKQGGAGTDRLKEFIDTHLDEDKIRKSKIDFGLLTVEFPSLKPHYMWKDDIPKGKISDFILASCSAFPALQVHDIDGKKYADGGVENNLPIHMAVERGATDIVAIYLDAIGRFDREKELSIAKNTNLIFIQNRWDPGNFLVFDKKNTDKLIQLGYQDTMKAFGVYDGNQYSFIKGTMDKRQLNAADLAAQIFELDPMILYSEERFLEDLKKEIKKVKEEFQGLFRVGKRVIKNRTLDLQGVRDVVENLIALAGNTVGAPGANLKQTGETLMSYNRKVLTLTIAYDLRENKENSIFLNRYPLRLLKEEVQAARFIEKNNLL